jgi:hypothetical protein
MTERYNTPAEGTLDWHIPLNENFDKLDKHVEIRDGEDDLGQYEPKSGAKFLATDTGAVYIGDGSQWNKIGTIDSSGSTTTADDGTIIAQPGDVQSAIDDASTGSEWGKSPTRVVKLVSGKNYYPSNTITVRRGVRLECNGARVVPDGDFNVFELYRDTELVSPHVDTRNQSWSSAQIVVGADDASKVEAANRAWVRDAYLMGDNGSGIGLQFRGGSGGPCSMQWANGTINGFDKAIDCYASGGDTSGQGDWSNGNHFEGLIRNYRVGISMRSEGAAVGGNTFRLQAQPNDSISEWLWYMEDDPRAASERGDHNYTKRGNHAQILPWDNNNYVNNPYYESSDRRPPVWYIGKGKQYGNSLMDLGGTLSNQFIVNNSDNPNRNGILTMHGGPVTGTSQFSHVPSYKRNDSRSWHEDSVN